MKVWVMMTSPLLVGQKLPVHGHLHPIAFRVRHFFDIHGEVDGAHDPGAELLFDDLLHPRNLNCSARFACSWSATGAPPYDPAHYCSASRVRESKLDLVAEHYLMLRCTKPFKRHRAVSMSARAKQEERFWRQGGSTSWLAPGRSPWA